MSNRHALIVDDDQELRDFLSAVIDGAGFETLSVATFDELRSRITDFEPDLIVLDLSLGDSDGIEVLRYLSERGSKASILMISSFDERLLRTTLTLGTQYGLNMLGNLQKPVTPAMVREMLAKLPEESANVRENDLTAAIDDDHLFLNFQPKCDIRTGKVLSAEALVRWNDPRRGTIFPDQFISLAERSGLISPMTDKILDLAIRAAKDWQDRGWNIAVAVNLSAGTLTDLEFPTKLSTRLREAGLNAGNLILEVTETTAMTDAQATLDILTRLRIKGMHVSLDDFGTGYSSLVELHKMPFSELKIDRSFVMEADTDPDSRIIVEAILGLAHAMNIKVVAEGVEKEEHWEFLKQAGCDMAQGYYLAKPMPPDAFTGWVERRESGG